MLRLYFKSRECPPEATQQLFLIWFFAGILFLTTALFSADVYGQGAQIVRGGAPVGLAYPKIQAAIDNAVAGDEIHVGAGVYTGTVVVTKSLTLKGAKFGVDPRPLTGSARVVGGVEESIIETPGNQSAVRIEASGVKIDGFEIRHSNLTGTADLVHSPGTASLSNVEFTNNIVSASTDEGIQLREFDNALVSKNYFKGVKGDAINMCQNTDGAGNKIHENEIADCDSPYGAIYLYQINGVEVKGNYIHGYGNGIALAPADAGLQVTNITVEGNLIESTFRAYISRVYGVGLGNNGSSGIQIRNNKIVEKTGESPIDVSRFAMIWIDDNPQNVTISNNYFEHNEALNYRYIHVAGTVTNQVNAECNWFGSSNGPDVASRVGGGGAISFVPFLSSGTDTDAGLGFVPVPGACTGPVHNLTQNTYYLQIQPAINVANPNDVIEVSAGSYTEALVIAKSLTLKGANAGKAGTDNARTAESVLLNSSLNTNGVFTIVVDGFHVLRTNDDAGDFFSLGGESVVTLQNNIFERNGTAAGVGARALATSPGPGAKVIANNLFTGSTSGGFFGGHKTWNSGIYVNDGSGNDVTIQNNTFRQIRSAINIDDYTGTGAKISGNTFETTGTYISFGGTVPTNGSYVLGANEFKTPISTFINLSNVDPAFRLDITSSTYNGAPLSSLAPADLFAIEATMYHRGRDGRKGLVYYVAGKQYVVKFPVASASSITVQNAVSYAPTSSSDIITLKDGTYNERVVVDKAVSIQGESKAGTLLDGTGLGNGRGITINSGVENVSINTLTVQNYSGTDGNTHAGIFATGGNNGLIVNNIISSNNSNSSGFYANGPVKGISITSSTFENNGPSGRGIVIWNGLKKDITISGNTLRGNICCGIELQDGAATGVLISGNTIEGNDSSISVVGLTSGSERSTAKANQVINNIITAKGRFGIEIKNPNGTGNDNINEDGAVIVSGNEVTFGGTSDARDLAGIAVIRRGVLSPPNIVNVDTPNGVILRGNIVSGFKQTSTSEGFGIVIEGTNHVVSGNTLTNNDVGIQQQAGYDPAGYPGDGNQNNVADNYFGRGNARETCSNTLNNNTFTGNGADQRNVGAGTGWVVNSNTNARFCSIQAAIDAATANDVIKLEAVTYEQNILFSKSVTLEGVNAGLCGTDAGRSAESVLMAPSTGDLIAISDNTTATIVGMKIGGVNIAPNLSGTGKNLIIRNSVFELNFVPNHNNIYFASNQLTLECNYFKAMAGTNNGGASTHIFFGGNRLTATRNKFTSEAARNSINASTTSLPVWFNLTTNGKNVNISDNIFDKIDIGVLLADNVGNVVIRKNDFIDAKRKSIPFGNGLGAGVAIYNNLNPSGPVQVVNNNFKNSETGVRTSGSGTNFPGAGLLTISYNGFTGISEEAINIGSSYAGATNKLNTLCNWFGAQSGPVIATNSGAGGSEIEDAAGKVQYKNWLIYGDDDNSAVGFQVPATVNVLPGSNISVAQNHYRVLSNAIGCALQKQTIALSGTFDYTAPVALAEWEKGNNGETGNDADQYTILAPVNLDSVYVTGPAIIQGPGDLPTANLESFLTFDKGYNRYWEISGLTIKDFDLGIGFFNLGNYPNSNTGTRLFNNTFYIPADLNADAAAADVNQNIGIHLANGLNQTVENNTVYLDGTGVSAGAKYATSVFLQSHTSGGNGYDGLKINNNQIIVTGVPHASEPAVIRGIWENGQNTAAAIEINGNTFTNSDAGNTADKNRQFAMWVTSRSSATKSVVYQNNEVTGFNEGISWIGGSYTSYTAPNYEATATPVQVLNNKFNKVKNGVVVRKASGSPNSGSPALVSNNSFAELVAGGFAIVNESTGETDAQCNWYDIPLAVNAISSTGGGSVKYLPKLVSGTDDNPGAIGFQTSAACELPVYNVSKNLQYLTIQAAVDAADPTNVIRVGTGIYPENVTVDKSLEIFGVDSTNVIVDKGNYAASAGNGFSITGNNVTIRDLKVQNFNFGITNTEAVSGLTLTRLNLNDNFGAGFYSNRSINGLTITYSNLNGNAYKGGVISSSAYKRGILLQSSGADYSNVVITNNTVNYNGLTGIDVNLNKSINGLTVKDNTAKKNADAQISIWLGNFTPASSAILVENNALELDVNARYGIEIKNMNATGLESGTGSIVLKGNTIGVAAGHMGADRDMAAIAVIRRKDGNALINDQPQGVVVRENTISGFQNPLAGDAFGIVIGGTGHRVVNNTISNTEFPIQLQKGNDNYLTSANSASDAGQTNTPYFDRDNSNDACADISGNTLSASGDSRIVTTGATVSLTLPVARVTNTTLGTKFCTIQQGIDYTATVNGHTLTADAGNYPENVRVTKSLTLLGPNSGVAGNGTRASEALIVPAVADLSDGKVVEILASNVTLKGFKVSGSNSLLGASAVQINGVSAHAANGVRAFGDLDHLTIENNIIADLGKSGVSFDANNGSTESNLISNNLFDNIPRHTSADGGSYGRGIQLANNFYASIVSNSFTRVERAMQTNNFSKAIESGVWEIKNNSIKAYNIGAFVNLHYAQTSDLVFEGNTIEKETATRTILPDEALPDALFTGVEVFSVSNAVKVVVKGGEIRNADIGIYSWNNPTSNHVTIDGVSFDNNGVGVMQSNYSRYPNAGNTTIDVKNVTIASGDAGKAFVAEDHASGSGALSAISLVENNSVAAAYPFHLQGGTKAQIKLANTTATLSTQDAITFTTSGTSVQPNVIIGENFVVNLAGNDLRVLELPAGAVLELQANFTAPNKVTKNPVSINGAVWFTNGVLNSGNGSIEFGNSASDILTGSHKENSNSYILGKALLLSRNVGSSELDMLGFKAASGANIGDVTITRATSTSGAVTPGFPGNGSIRTVWDINSSVPSANRASVQFRYLNIAGNINGQNSASVYAYRYNSVGSQWEKKTAQLTSSSDSDVLTTEVFGIAEFSSWTLSSSPGGPDFRPSITMLQRNYNASNLSRSLTVSVINLGTPPSGSGPISIVVVKPNDSFILQTTNPDWAIQDFGADGYWRLTYNGTAAVTAGAPAVVAATLSIPNANAKGKVVLSLTIPNGTLGDSNNSNNKADVPLTVN